MKAQEVVAAVLVIALTISAISLVYAWASPILNKATDKVNLEKCISYSEVIEKAVEHVAKNGDTVDVQVKIPGFIYFKDNQIIIKCSANTKLLPSYFVPLSYNQLPMQRENVLCNSTGVCGSNCKNGTVELGGVIYNFNISNGNTICIDSCSGVGGNVLAGGKMYEVAYIDPDNNYSYILGGYVNRYGVYGVDPLGVVIGRQHSDIELRIVFWPLIDEYGMKHTLHIESDEISSNGDTTLHISLDSSNQTDTYIKVNVI